MKHKSFVMCRILDYRFCCLHVCFWLRDSIIFRCSHRKDEALPEGVTVEGGTLRFVRALSLTDQGVYVCTTTNEVGSGRAEILITISGVYPTGNPSPRLKCNTQCCHLVKIICNCIFTFAFSKRFYPNPNYSGYTFLQYVSHNIS